MLSQFGDFEDTICVGQRRPQDSDESVMLFIKMKGDSKSLLSKATVAAVRAAISKALSPRHVPKYIFQVPEIPYTINGKKIELAVKQIVSGQTVVPSGAVANPESLEYYKRFARDEVLSRSGDMEKTSSKL